MILKIGKLVTSELAKKLDEASLVVKGNEEEREY